MAKCYIIRQYRGQDAIVDALRASINAGVLRQGWGVSGTDLRQPVEQWVPRFILSAPRVRNDCVTTEKVQAIYWNLKPLTDIAPGDLIVVPNMPERRSFTIALPDVLGTIGLASQITLNLHIKQKYGIDEEDVQGLDQAAGASTTCRDV